MAKTDPKKPNFPTKSCPKCGKLIHARSHSHEACGWVMAGNGKPAPATSKKVGRPKKAAGNGRTAGAVGAITLDDITAVKTLVAKMGAEKVRQLAQVLTK
jgi:hypothetical protein